jgi:uncharacterized Zn finger protein (UPF0148 family)
MQEATIEKPACGNCGVDVRENTLFCYNCGSRVVEDKSVESPLTVETNGLRSGNASKAQAALDDLANRLKNDELAGDKLAKAAAERRKARVRRRKSKEVVWEPNDDLSAGLILLLAVIITAITACIVFLVIIWR